MTHKFSSIPEIEKQLISTEKRIAEKGILLTVLKEIPYGIQIEGDNGTVTGKAAFYWSKKKGYSAVASGKANEVSKALCDYFLGKENEEVKPFRAIIGSDEAGKGDFFGPLVTVAFFIEDEKMEQELLDLGIRDSKKLTDKKIQAMAKEIHKRWPDHYQVVGPKVEKYNQLYGNIKNLNKFLGWMHGRAICDLTAHWKEQGVTIKEAVVDKFADVKNIIHSVGGLDDINIDAVVRGEEAEVAIAAASVMARDGYLFRMKMLDQNFDMHFPLGCAAQVKDVGRAFIKKHGQGKLNQVCKTHFKTYNEL